MKLLLSPLETQEGFAIRASFRHISQCVSMPLARFESLQYIAESHVIHQVL